LSYGRTRRRNAHETIGARQTPGNEKSSGVNDRPRDLHLRLPATAQQEYPLRVTPDGGAELDAQTLRVTFHRCLTRTL